MQYIIYNIKHILFSFFSFDLSLVFILLKSQYFMLSYKKQFSSCWTLFTMIVYFFNFISCYRKSVKQSLCFSLQQLVDYTLVRINSYKKGNNLLLSKKCHFFFWYECKYEKNNSKLCYIFIFTPKKYNWTHYKHVEANDKK